MFKKAMAIMLAAVMLLQPVMASAVTWGAVVDTINTLRENNVEFDYVVEDGVTSDTKVTVTGDSVKIEKGTITGVNIDDGSAGDYTFIDVAIDGEEFRIYLDSETAKVSLEGNTELNVDGVYVDANSNTASGTLTVKDGVTINANRVEMFAQQGGQAVLDNQGNIVVKMDEEGDEYSSGIVRNVALEGGNVDFDNTGIINTESGMEFFANNATIDFTNNDSINGEWVSLNATDGSAITAENGEGGVIQVGDQLYVGASSYDDKTKEHGDKATISFDNAGTIDAGRNTYIVAMGDADTTFNNSGTITNEVYSEVGYSSYGEEDEGYVEAASKVTEDMQTSITITNTGEITDYLATNSWQQGSMDVGNEGSIGDMFADSFGKSETSVSNAGSVSGELYMGTHGESSGRLENSGETSDLYVFADESGKANAENKGTVAGDNWFDAMGDSSVTLSNSGTFENGIGGGADEGASLAIQNSGTVNGQIYGEGWGDANVTVSNTDEGTVDSVWVNGMGDSQVSATNNGKVNGEFGGGVNESGSMVKLENNGQVDSSWVSAYGGGSITMQNNATIEGSIGVSTDGATKLNIAQGEKATGGEIGEIYIETGSNEVLSDEKIAKITENLNLGSESLIHTVNEEGQITAIYEVNEAGEVELVESFVKVEPVVDNGPSPEMIRHWMEQLRQEQAIGGVYGSPYWLKQLYLGYHSLNLRLFENGERELFWEMLSWYNGGPEKRLTLRVNVENPQDLTMRLDGEVIDILERCEFAVITLQDKNKNVVMEYNVADLKAARALYGLARTDLLCVGGPDSEVMKIGADGQMVPVEQTAEK